MTGDDQIPPEYLVAHLRAELAAGPTHQLALRISADEDWIRVSGPVESDAVRELVLAEVARVLDRESPGRAVTDALVVAPGRRRSAEAIE